MSDYKPASQARAVADKQKPKTLIDDVVAMGDQIKNALPAFMKNNSERMLRIIMTEIRKNPRLNECSRESFLASVMEACQLGLEIGSSLGQAYLVPYKTRGSYQCQLIIGYQGMIELAERTGEVTIDAYTVFEKDKFKFRYGIAASIEHEPYFGDDDPGPVVASYAIARYKDGRYKFILSSKRSIEDAKKSSKGADDAYSPWKNYYAAMACKTSVRKLFKFVPKSAEIRKAIEVTESEFIPFEDRPAPLAIEAISNDGPEITLEEQEALGDGKG